MKVDNQQQIKAASLELFSALNNPRFCDAACLEAIRPVMTKVGYHSDVLLRQIDPTELPASSEGNTVLHICAKRGFTAVIKFLVDSKAFPNCDINIKNAKQKTPLDIAAEKGHFAIVQHLMKNEAVIADSGAIEYNRTIFSYLSKNFGIYKKGNGVVQSHEVRASSMPRSSNR